MATISDFGTLEVKRLRVDEEIIAARYGTEIRDKDLIFKVGDISNPNQSIRFTVHDGDTYKDAFTVDSSGFGVSDLKMSGPQTGVIGIDDVVKLGEMRVQHFNDHNNQRSGEIIFSVNIGDTDKDTVDVLSLSPEQVEISTPAKVNGDLSCGTLFSSTMASNGNPFRSAIAIFSHPLASNSIVIERDETGIVVLSGPLKSTEAEIDTLINQSLHTTNVSSTNCSVSSLNLEHWSMKQLSGDLIIEGAGGVRINDMSTSYLTCESAILAKEVLCNSLSSSSIDSQYIQSTLLSTSSLCIKQLDCGDYLNLPQSSKICLADTTITINNNCLTIDCPTPIVISETQLTCGGVTCRNGNFVSNTLD
jgi:hypothetical protein